MSPNNKTTTKQETKQETRQETKQETKHTLFQIDSPLEERLKNKSHGLHLLQ